MAGLRERQKEQRKEAILVAAMELFNLGGYSATTVEQIAAKAEVSAPTVFNYFGTKQEILLALVGRAGSLGVDDARIELDKYDDAVDALCALYNIITTSEQEALPRSIWRELLGSTLSSSVSSELLALNQRTTRGIATLIKEMQSRGMLSAHFDAEFVAVLLNDYTTQLFARQVTADEPDYAMQKDYIRRVVGIMVSGLHPD